MGKVTQNFVNNFPFDWVTLTIPISTTTSGILDCSKYPIAGIYTPAALTGTSLTFQASYNNSTFVTVGGLEVTTAHSVPILADRYIPLNRNIFIGIPFLRIVSNATELAARNFICILRPLT